MKTNFRSGSHSYESFATYRRKKPVMPQAPASGASAGGKTEIVTAGLWGLIWITLAIVGGIERRMVTIDDYGNVLDRKI